MIFYQKNSLVSQKGTYFSLQMKIFKNSKKNIYKHDCCVFLKIQKKVCVGGENTIFNYCIKLVSFVYFYFIK